MIHLDMERQERWSESSLKKAAMEEKEIVTSKVTESTVSSSNDKFATTQNAHGDL